MTFAWGYNYQFYFPPKWRTTEIFVIINVQTLLIMQTDGWTDGEIAPLINEFKGAFFTFWANGPKPLLFPITETH